MKISSFAFRLISLVMTLVLISTISGLSVLAADESDYVAEFRIETDKASAKKDEDVEVSVFLKTNYYICTMSLAVIYNCETLTLQNTSATSPGSFLTFSGSMADTYMTNGNWKSPETFYTKRNSDTSFWSKEDVMNKYKIVYATWSADTSLSPELVCLSEEEAVLSFTVRANKDIDDLSELVFISLDFLKTSSAPQGILFVGRSTTKEYAINNMVTSGQTIIYNGVDPTEKEKEACASISPADGTGTVVDKERGLIYGIDEGIYSLEGYVDVEGYTLEYTYLSDSFGTGTRVDCLLNGQIKETYYIVVFGDLSGDAVIDTYDATILAAIANFDIQVEDGSVMALAADIANNDGVADTYDLATIFAVVNGDCVISQTENHFAA